MKIRARKVTCALPMDAASSDNASVATYFIAASYCKVSVP